MGHGILPEFEQAESERALDAVRACHWRVYTKHVPFMLRAIDALPNWRVERGVVSALRRGYCLGDAPHEWLYFQVVCETHKLPCVHVVRSRADRYDVTLLAFQGAGILPPPRRIAMAIKKELGLEFSRQPTAKPVDDDKACPHRHSEYRVTNTTRRQKDDVLELIGRSSAIREVENS